MNTCKARALLKTRALLPLILGSWICSAHAGGTETGVIQQGWNVYADGAVFFYLNGTHQGSPCQISERWAFDAKTEHGKVLYSAFLTAYTTGRPVQIIGTGTCIHNNTEAVADFYVQ